MFMRVFFFFYSFSLTANETTIEFDVKEKVTLSSFLISLKDITDCNTPFCKENQELILENFKSPNITTYLYKQNMEKKLKSLHPDKNFTLKGPLKTTVHGDHKKISFEKISHELHKTIDNINNDNPDIKFILDQIKDPKQDFSTWSEDSSINFSKITETYLQLNFTRNLKPIPFTVESEGFPVIEYKIFVSMKSYKKAFVAKTDLERDDILTENSMEETYVEELFFHKKNSLKKSDYIGKMLKHKISKNMTFEEKDLQNPIVIKRGQNTHMQLKTSSMEINSVVKALEDSSLGQITKFLQSSNKKILAGRTISKDRVEYVP